MAKFIANMIISYMHIFLRDSSPCSLPHVLSVLDGVSETDEQKSERVGQEAGDTNKTDDDKETSTLTDKLEDLTVKGAKSSDSDASREEGDSKDKPSDSNETKAA